jgi:RNA polymerase-binding transcription factor DksA
MNVVINSKFMGILDKEKIKEKLEQERKILLEELQDIGKFDSETGKWEPVPEEVTYNESDQNEMADRFEDFEERSSLVDVLGGRLKNILDALEHIQKESFGKCKICKKDIEMDRFEINPSAKTCKNHIDT